jgi:phospholipase/lecithinase/hemolysin
VPNCDDVSRQPAVIRTHNEETRAGLQGRVLQLNAALASALATLDQSLPDLRIVSPDAFGIIGSFIEHPEEYEMTKTYPAAIQDEGLIDRSFSGPGADYVFWDEYGHPTSKAHALIAARFLSVLMQARPERLRLVRTDQGLNVRMEKLLVGRAYSLQSSPNLTDWREVFAFNATTGTNEFPVPASSPPAAFFRLSWSQ